MADRSWPMEHGFRLVSPFGPRDGAFHRGQDFGWEGGSAGRPVYAAQGGYIAFCRYDAPIRGPGSGFGWYFGIDHPDEDGGGFTVYGHCVLELDVNQRVHAGQRVGHINPDRISNGQVDPHLHFEVLPFTYQPGEQFDPLPWLADASYPGEHRAAADTGSVWAQILEQQIGPPL